MHLLSEMTRDINKEVRASTNMYMYLLCHRQTTHPFCIVMTHALTLTQQVKSQNKLLDTMGDSFGSASDLFKNTIGARHIISIYLFLLRPYSHLMHA